MSGKTHRSIADHWGDSRGPRHSGREGNRKTLGREMLAGIRLRGGMSGETTKPQESFRGPVFPLEETNQSLCSSALRSVGRRCSECGPAVVRGVQSCPDSLTTGTSAIS